MYMGIGTAALEKETRSHSLLLGCLVHVVDSLLLSRLCDVMNAIVVVRGHVTALCTHRCDC